MPIAAKPVADITPRDNVISDIGLMIGEAANAAEDIDPWSLALAIVARVEQSVNSVDGGGNVIYRD